MLGATKASDPLRVVLANAIRARDDLARRIEGADRATEAMSQAWQMLKRGSRLRRLAGRPRLMRGLSGCSPAAARRRLSVRTGARSRTPRPTSWRRGWRHGESQSGGCGKRAGAWVC